MGDGRLQAQGGAGRSYYHVLVLDAFSSDAIPVHLLTRTRCDCTWRSWPTAAC